MIQANHYFCLRNQNIFRLLKIFYLFISNIVHYILGNPKILQDNYETTVIREATLKKDIQKH